MKQKPKHLVIVLHVRRWKVGEAVLEINVGNSALHQAPSLCRDGFRMLHPSTFNAVGDEEGIQEHGILDSGKSFIMGFSEECGSSFVHGTLKLPQPNHEEFLQSMSEGLATLLARSCFAFSHALRNVTFSTKPIYFA